MTAWLDSLTVLQYVMLVVAVPATLVMALQTLLLLFGLHSPAGEDADSDGDCDDCDGSDSGDHHWPPSHFHLEGDEGEHTARRRGVFGGLRVFTIRGVVAFLAILGWGSLWLLEIGLYPPVALFFGAAMGVWAMVLMALLLRVALRLQSDGTVLEENALGHSGTVYLTIPAARSGEGKVTVLVQERLREFQAVTDQPTPLCTGREIIVTGLSAERVLVVAEK